MSGETPLRTQVDDGVGWLVFDNPARHNALTIEMARLGIEALAAFDADEGVRVIALRGAGERAFMSGADIGEQGREPDLFRETAHRFLDALAVAEKPVIAAISGYCLGGGVSVALQADLRVASDTGTFGVPAAKLGIAYPWNSIGPLVALVGPGFASDLLFTGRRIDAAEARAIGLVEHVLPSEGFEGAALEFASQIARNAPLSLRAAKAGIRATRPRPDAVEMADLAAMLRRCETSADYQEGQAAFRERRAPRFTGG